MNIRKIFKGKNNKKRVVILVLTLILIALGWRFYSYLRGPSEGVINTSVGIPQSSNNISIVTLNGSNASFDYQSDLKQDSNSKSQPNVSEYYIFKKPTDVNSPSEYLAITIYKLPTGKATDNSPLNYRLNHPELYKKSTLSVNNSNVTLMTKTDGSELDAFLLKGDRLAAIILTSPSATNNELQDRFDATLNSWNWH